MHGYTFMRNMYFHTRRRERSFNYNAAINACRCCRSQKCSASNSKQQRPAILGEARRLPKFRLMLLFETLLVRGGYNSGLVLKWPRVQQPSSISNILQGSEIRLLVFFPHSALAVPILPFALSLLILRLSLFPFSSIYPSIHAPGSLLRGCLFSEFIHASWWRGPHYPR